MTTYYAKSAGSILAANAWNTAADGSGTDATFADGSASGHTLDLNGKAMTSPTGTALTCTLLQAATGTLTPTGTLAITGNVTYSGTSTSGMLVVGSGASLTVNGSFSNTSSGYGVVVSSTGTVTVNGQTSCSGSGRAISQSNTSVVTLSNSGSTALSVSSGVGLYSTGGTFSITGNVGVSDGYGYYNNGSVGTSSITGNLTVTGTGFGLRVDTHTINITGNVSVSNTGAGIYLYNGTVNLDGELLGCGQYFTSWVYGHAILVAAGTFNWIGSRSIAAGSGLKIGQTGGTINLATASGALSLAVSGMFSYIKTGGTLNYTAAGGTAAIVRQTSSAGVVTYGWLDSERAIVSGPTLPAANKVKRGSGQFGYAGSLLTPDYYPPNSGDSPYTEDASLVLVGATYGEANAVDGTGSGGGYTYGDDDASKVLTTATGAGTYVPIADSDAVDGGVEYGVGEEGTGVNATTLAGILDARNLSAAYIDAPISSRHASGAAVAKSPATLAAADVSGNLPADVKAYTVQPTVTGATLHSDYDAAKTAASQTSVNDLPTNSEFAAALAAADDAVLAAIAALNNLSSAQAQSAASAALAAWGKTGFSLASASITSSTFDETTAFPLKSVDAGATSVSRTGADGDTMKTLSDQLDATLTAIRASTAFRYGVASPAITFVMSLSGVPVASLTVTATVRKDSGAFSAATGTVSEVGNGLYTFSGFSATEMQCAMICLRLTATGADDKLIEIPVGSA